MTQQRETYLDDWEVSSDLLTMLAVLNHELQLGLSESYGLSTTKFRILLKLKELDGAARVGDIARRLDLKSNAVSQAISNLKERKLIKRTKDPADKRLVLVVLTDKGAAVIAEASAGLAERFLQVWEDVPEGIARTMQDIVRYIGAVVEGNDPNARLQGFSSEYITTIAESYATVTGVLKAAHLTLTECRTLCAIRDLGGTARMVGLSRTLMVPPNTATWLADQLVEREYVLRDSTGVATQGVTLKLTELGDQALKDGIAAVSSLCRSRLWRGLSEAQMKDIFEAAAAFAKVARKHFAG